MSIRSIFLAASAILATANGHMIMKSPVPYAVDKLDNSPISQAQYPCKSQNGFGFTSATAMKVGEQQEVQLGGSAIHGGGGCQLSIAQGTSPTASTVFKVIKTIEGCPTAPNFSMNFTLPKGTPNGDLTFAWTWNSRLAGTTELYMNCAPITVSGGADDTSAFDALPDMLVANIGTNKATDCYAIQNMNIKYPNPGSVLELAPDAFTGFAAPTGNCGSTGNTPAVSSGGAPAASSAPPEAPASSAAPVTSAAASNPGGVFAPGASSAASSGAGALPQSTLTTLVTVTAVPSTPVQATSAPAAGTGTPATPSSGTPATGGTACSVNGAVVCNGATQFGLCDNGKVVWQDVAAGTTCNNGAITKRTIVNRRAPRPRVVVGQDFTPEE